MIRALALVPADWTPQTRDRRSFFRPWLESVAVLYTLFGLLGLAYKVVTVILTVYTTPSDFSDLWRSLAPFVTAPAWYYWVILGVGLLLLVVTSASGAWRHAFARVVGRDRLKTLADECARMSDDLASLLADQRRARDADMARDHAAMIRGERSSLLIGSSTASDSKFIEKYMTRCQSIVKRLQKEGYWKEDDPFMNDVSSVGAIWYSVETLAKDFFHASQLIKEDLDRSILDVLLSPREQIVPQAKARR